ncbi:MAG: HAD-IC family P-type ATPase, partial [Myxococcota bacterium]
MDEIVDEHAHAVPSEDVARLMGTHPTRGLDRFEVEERQRRHGPNRLSERRGKGPILRFLEQFHQPLVYILLGAAAITSAFGEWVDAGVILGVVLVNAVVGFIQEARALEAIAALSRTMTSMATVVRGGARHVIPSTEVVAGDLVVLQSGDRVPADLRLLRARELQVDESALTGESVPATKSTAVVPPDAGLGDRHNMAYASTLATYGTGTGVVVSIGDGTEIGRISEMIASAELLQTPLTLKIKAFSRILLMAILGLAGVTFLVGLLRGQGAFETFMAVVALAVGAIPEGLPAAVTIMLAIGVSRMASRRAIIRRLPAVETLGSTTLVCSDKTGTLTQNEMTVQKIAAGDATVTIEGTGYEPRGALLHEGQAVNVGHHPALRETLVAGALCNDSDLHEQEDRWRVDGDPTEGALLVSARKAGLHEETLNGTLPRLDAIPFESQHQYMATMHDAGPDRPRVVYVKGSIEALLPRCHHAYGGGPLDHEAVHEQAAAMGAQGLRVLAFARREMPADADTVEHEDVGSGLELLGLQGMIDPPRPEA